MKSAEGFWVEWLVFIWLRLFLAEVLSFVKSAESFWVIGVVFIRFHLFLIAFKLCKENNKFFVIKSLCALYKTYLLCEKSVRVLMLALRSLNME